MTVKIYFGTESGNSEMVAFDIADAHGAQAEDLSDVEVESLSPEHFYLIVCSTHGEGELPQSAVPFMDALGSSRPDLTGLRYAMFGLGDSTYPNYSKGSEHIDTLFAELGAERIGEYGRHDAAGREDVSELALVWAAQVVEQHEAARHAV
ncbi:MAG: flavodoxin domain-containing protein [Gulosibacter sp.]|uniref:flavodoxin domain-containing protein n=1 Tax=Gulosibacter sp. TaxID=2817531 RepID=UPI003F90CB5E